jgi:hypothetical protein
MKTTRFLLITILVGLIAVQMSSCKKCKGEDPSARIINNGTTKASVQIKTTDGNTVNINNVDPGTSSAYASYAAGDITFTIVVNNINYVKIVTVTQCFDYDIAIDANNNITTTAIDRNK